MQQPEITKLIDIILTNPAIGAFKLQLSSNRFVKPKATGMPDDLTKGIIREIDTKKLRDQLYESTKHLYETPVRLDYGQTD